MKQMLLFIKKNIHAIICCTGILTLIIFEYTFLNRPYYWDEAWSYGSAIKAMYETGPSLMPGAIHEYLYRGHPLFFYFITTIWMKIFGSSLIAVHSFFLIISVLLLASVFFIGMRYFNKTVALFAFLFLLGSPLFISQATFLLPEIMLALFSILCFYFYLEKKLFPEIFFGTLLVLTKETGLVLISTIVFYDFITKIRASRNFQSFLHNFPTVLWHVIPLGFVGLFFILQKIKLGWFLYPEHTEMMTFNLSEIFDKFLSILRYMMQLEGRILLSIIALPLLIFLLVRKKITKNESAFLGLSGLFMLGYLLFSAINFYTIRYAMSLLPFFYFIIAFVLYKVFEERIYISGIVVALFLFVSISYSYNSKSLGDSTIGYKNMIKVHKQAVNYCEDSNYYSKSISTSFLMNYNLKDSFMGYLKSDKKFENVYGYSSPFKTDIVIISTIELPGNTNDLKVDKAYKLEKRFEENMAWCEIYKKITAQ